MGRHARPDWRVARLWTWARGRREPWTWAEAAAACKISSQRCRGVLEALAEAGLLARVDPAKLSGQQDGSAAKWKVSRMGLALNEVPGLVVDPESHTIVGVRFADIDTSTTTRERATKVVLTTEMIEAGALALLSSGVLRELSPALAQSAAETVLRAALSVFIRRPFRDGAAPWEGEAR